MQERPWTRVWRLSLRRVDGPGLLFSLLFSIDYLSISLSLLSLLFSSFLFFSLLFSSFLFSLFSSLLPFLFRRLAVN